MRNIGILSTSSIAPRFIAAVREEGSFEITALSSRTLEKAREKAAQWDIPTAYGSHKELLNDPDVNIVYIRIFIRNICNSFFESVYRCFYFFEQNTKS